ncbi:MAG: hypothetical protein ACYCS7_01785 [Acidimicrobiales bacterium]
MPTGPTITTAESSLVSGTDEITWVSASPSPAMGLTPPAVEVRALREAAAVRNRADKAKMMDEAKAAPIAT